MKQKAMPAGRQGFAPIIILILIALAVVGYLGYKNYWPKLQTLVTSTPTPTASPESPEGKVFCPTKRPEVCTMECIQNPPYICGSDGKSYCTVCQACSNKAVAWYEMRTSPCGEGKFCGGFAANLPENQCPDGFYCKLDGSYPDAGGKCVKK